MILSRRHDVELVAIDKGKEGELLTVQKFLNNHARTRVAKFIVQ